MALNTAPSFDTAMRNGVMQRATNPARIEFARHIGALSDRDVSRLLQLAGSATWREVPSREYITADVEFWEPCKRAFFILIPAGGKIHRHHDKAIEGTTHHLVLLTNANCLNWWIDDDGERHCHMAAGQRYEVARDPIHWAENRGATDRIHLLVEYP